MPQMFEKLSSRSIRIIYTVLGLLVLALAGYNFLHIMVWRVHSNDQCEWEQRYTDSTRIYIDMIETGGSGDLAGLEGGDILLAIDGVPVSQSEEAKRILLTVPAGASAVFTIERDRRERSIRWRRGQAESGIPFVVYDRLGFGLVITNIVPGGVTDQAGARDGDILLRIGDVSILHHLGPMYLIDQYPAGGVVQFTVDRDGEIIYLDVRILKLFNVSYFAQFLLGLGFLLVGYFVVMVRPDGGIQRKFARFGYFTLLFFSYSEIITGSMYADPAWKIYTLIALSMVIRIVAPPTFLTFFLHFPYRHRILDRKWIIPSLYVFSAACTFPRLANILGWGLFSEDWIRIAGFLLYGFFLAGLIVFTLSYYSADMQPQRGQLRPILISALIGIVTFAYLIVIRATYPMVIFLDPWLLLPVLLLIGIPPAFGYSIVKHRVMDVTVFVKRSIIYGIVTMTIAMIYLVLVFGLGNLIGSIMGQTDNQALTVVAFVIIALLFDPLKKRVQDGVDRVFYQERYSYQKALLQFSRDLPRTIQLGDVLSSIVHTISSTMHVEKVGVGLCDDNVGCSMMARGIPEDLCRINRKGNGIIEHLERTRMPMSFEGPDEALRQEVTSEELASISEAGVVLFIPMFLQDRLIGTIIVGPKLSGKMYSQEDVDLLSTVAGQAAIAIENARLLQSEVEKQKYMEQLAVARRIQQGLLPRGNPRVEGLDIAGISIPAMSVGGDYFDYIMLPDDRLLVVVGDVAGKGMSAALYMARVQGLIRYATHLYSSPRDILTSVNRHIYEGIERNSFVTMILALFDLKNQEVIVCRAGHTQPLIVRNGTLSYIGSEGMGLGLEQGSLFEESLREVAVPMHSGNTFLLYSDGLTESMNSTQQEFGEERVGQVLTASVHSSSQELQNELLKAVGKHRGSAEQHDDITFVVIQVK